MKAINILWDVDTAEEAENLSNVMKFEAKVYAGDIFVGKS